MDKFNIRIMLQQTILWPFFTAITVYFILYVIAKQLKFIKEYIESHGNPQKYFVPGINTQYLYPSILLSHYKNSSPERPALCSLLQSLTGFCRLYGKDGLLRGHLLFKAAVCFFKAEAVEALLGNADVEKSREYKLMVPLLGDGLITSSGTKWRKSRKLLTPTFHFSILEDCIPVFQEHATILVSKIKSRTEEPWIDVMPLLSYCSLDIICQSAMGVCMNFQTGGNSDYYNAYQDAIDIIIYRTIRPWLYQDIIFNLTTLGRKFNYSIDLVHKMNEGIMKQKMDKMKKENFNSIFDNKSDTHSLEKKTRKPFLELLIEHHLKDHSFTEDDIKNEVNTFLSAGQDSTSKYMGWILYCVGLYPDVQRKIHEELDDIFRNEEDVYVTREALSKMKYLECVIKETSRVYPVIPFIARENQQDLKVLNYTVRKNTLCVILLWELYRDPEYFPDPEKFIPERFLPENSAGRHPYAYIPFSAGPRNCIGQKFAMLEMKTVMACVLRQFRVKSLDPRDKVLVYPNIVLSNAHPLRVRFERR